MIILYSCCFILLFVGIKHTQKSSPVEYLSKESTLPIKGFFVLLVFFRHFKQYITLSTGILDKAFDTIDGFLGQLIVVMFLFYSGYGIFKQYREKNGEYIRPFLKHRFLPVWTQFAICIVFFIIVDACMGVLKTYGYSTIAVAFIGWTSVGNSNWFMFVTFAFYLITYFSFRLFSFKKPLGNLLIISTFTLVLLVILYVFQTSYWWNTIFCFPLGMWYAYFQKHIDKWMQKTSRYCLSFLFLVVLFFGLQILQNNFRFPAIISLILPVLFR